MGYSLYEIDALAYHFGLSCEEVRRTDFTREEIDKAIQSYDGKFSGGRKDESEL